MLELHKTSLIPALLVSRLPNLRTLAVARYSSSRLYQIQTAVSHAVLSLSVSTVQCGPFSRLREVDFATEDSEDDKYPSYLYGAPGDFEASFLLPFLSLPSKILFKA